MAYAALINAFSEATREDPSLAGFLNMAGVLVGAFDGETANPFRDDSFEDVRSALTPETMSKSSIPFCSTSIRTSWRPASPSCAPKNRARTSPR